jgi:hypothetical protein
MTVTGGHAVVTQLSLLVVHCQLQLHWGGGCDVLVYHLQYLYHLEVHS